MSKLFTQFLLLNNVCILKGKNLKNSIQITSMLNGFQAPDQTCQNTIGFPI